jgi:[ribosomal protein S5]-alanine N-acetyltransferase
MKLVTNRLVLRDYKEDDLDSLVSQINDLEVTKNLSMVPHPYTIKGGREYLARAIEKQNQKPRTDYSFAIELQDQSGVIGCFGLHSIDRYDGTATAGCWLGQDYWRKGYMSEAAERVLRFAFNTLKLRRINSEAFVENIGSNKMQQNLGFQLEGTRKQSSRSKATGIIHDANQYGLLREDWLKRQ